MFNWKLNRVKYTLPNFQIGRTNKDNRNARLVDINAVVDSTNTILTEIDTEVSNLGDRVTALEDWTYVEVPITETMLEAGGGNLLPALSSRLQYYVLGDFILETNFVGADGDWSGSVDADDLFVIGGNIGGASVNASFINTALPGGEGDNRFNVVQLVPVPGFHIATALGEANVYSNISSLNQANDTIRFAVVDGGTMGGKPLTHTGTTPITMIAKFYYKIGTKGTGQTF